MKTLVGILKKNKAWIISILSALAFLGIWEITAAVINVQIILPRIGDVAIALGEILIIPKSYITIGMSLLRCLISFSAAFVLGVLLGILGGISKTLAAAIRPLTVVLKSMPTMAIVLILMLAIGKDASPIVIGIMLVFPVIYETVKTAVENIDIRIIELARLDGITAAESVRHIYIPITMPYIAGAVASSAGLTIKGVISAEIVAYTAMSIGWEMKIASAASTLTEIPKLFAWVIIVLALSILFESALKLLFTRAGKQIS